MTGERAREPRWVVTAAIVLVLAVPSAEAQRRPSKRLLGYEQVVTARHLENMAKVMLATGMMVSYGYVMESGKVVLDGPVERLRQDRDVQEFYLGRRGGGQKSYREVKHYKRRKRWLS